MNVILGSEVQCCGWILIPATKQRVQEGWISHSNDNKTIRLLNLYGESKVEITIYKDKLNFIVTNTSHILQIQSWIKKESESQFLQRKTTQIPVKVKRNLQRHKWLEEKVVKK